LGRWLALVVGVLVAAMVAFHSSSDELRSGAGVCDWGKKPGFKECLEREFLNKPVQELYVFFGDSGFARPYEERDERGDLRIVFGKTVNDLAGYRVVVFAWVDDERRVIRIEIA
jgi:hypothetical protein